MCTSVVCICQLTTVTFVQVQARAQLHLTLVRYINISAGMTDVHCNRLLFASWYSAASEISVDHSSTEPFCLPLSSYTEHNVSDGLSTAQNVHSYTGYIVEK